MRPDSVRILQHPTVEPVSLTEARHQVGLMPDQTEHDELLVRAISTGRRLIEKRLGATLVATQYRAAWSDAPAILDLPNPPLLTGAAYPVAVTAAGVAVSSADYEIDAYSMPATVNFDQVPTGEVVATYWAGVAPGAMIEPTIKSALLMYVTHAFENRAILSDNGTAQLPHGFETLLAASSWSGGY